MRVFPYKNLIVSLDYLVLLGGKYIMICNGKHQKDESAMLKILCIEDNRLNSRLVKKLISRIGIEVLQAETAWQGLQKAKSEQVALMLINFDLPDMDGLELIRRVKADSDLAHIPILVMLNASKLASENPCHVVDCEDILDKPIVPHALYNALRRYLPEAFETVVWFSE